VVGDQQLRPRHKRPRQGQKRLLERTWRILTILVLILLALTAIIPFLWMFSTALKTRADVFAYPPVWFPEVLHWENFTEVFQAFPFARYALNSTFVALTVTFFQTLTSAMAAYTFARLSFPGRDRLFLLYLGTMMVPGLVTLIPSYILMTDRFFGLIDTYWALILPASLGGAFNTFLLRQFMLGLAPELEDAARIDGASPFGIFFRIVLPLSRPALAVVAVFTFMGTWNDFIWPLLMIHTPDKQTLTLGLASMQGRWATRWPELMAGTLMSVTPVILLLVFFQRYFEEGITFSGTPK
jgi:multiple sugar transport system permease protein